MNNFNSFFDNLLPLRHLFPFVQSVLPTVFDDSLSYLETLGKVVKALNDTESNVNTLEQAVRAFAADLAQYENLTITPVEITFNNDTGRYAASMTYADIVSAMDEGHTMVAHVVDGLHDTEYYSATMKVTETGDGVSVLYWESPAFTVNDVTVFYEPFINENDTVGVTTRTITGSGGGVDAFIIHYNSETETADKTFAEIVTAIEAEKTVMLIADRFFISSAHWTTTGNDEIGYEVISVDFNAFNVVTAPSGKNLGCVTYAVDDADTWTVTRNAFPNESRVNALIDIKLAQLEGFNSIIILDYNESTGSVTYWDGEQTVNATGQYILNHLIDLASPQLLVLRGVQNHGVGMDTINIYLPVEWGQTTGAWFIDFYRVYDGNVELVRIPYATNIVTKTQTPIGGYVTPEMFGAIGDGVTDDTTAIQAAFDSGKVVFLPNKYKITSTLDLNCLEHATKTVILTGELNFDNCFLWITGYNVTVCGGGKITGTAPDALVVLGGLPDVQNVNCINATLEDIYIFGTRGATACGGVIIRNYYLGEFGAYCNTLRSIYCEDTTFAVKLIGDANANNISNIKLMSYDDNNVIAMFVFEGVVYDGNTYAPLENIFESSFYFRGPDTPMLLVKSNTGSSFRRNVFDTLVCEQQGATADSVFIAVENGASPRWNQFINISANTYGGAFKPAVGKLLFDNNNTFIGDTFNYQQDISSKSLAAENLFSMKETRYIHVVKKGTTSENTSVKLFTANGVSPSIGDPKSQGAMIQVSVVENRNGAPILQHAEKITLFVGNSEMSISEQQANSRFSINGYSLYYQTGNNGTSVTDIRLTVGIEILSYVGGADYLLTELFGS